MRIGVIAVWCRVALFAGLLCVAMAGNADIVEGRDYLRLAQRQPTSAPGRTEVLEFFSYGCPACYVFHPSVTRWTATLPADTSFVRVPISMGRPQWKPLVRAYYALQRMGRLEELDTLLFDAIHIEKRQLFDEQSITAWVNEQEVDPTDFTAVFRSAEVEADSARAEQLARSYGIDRTPMLCLDGQYVIRAKKRLEELTEVADQLIARLRAEQTR